MTFKAALLSAPAASGKGVFLRIDELDGYGALTPCHLPAVTKCDLPPGRYYWVPSEKEIEGDPNPWGGAFWPIGTKPLDERHAQTVQIARAKILKRWEGLLR